jgi:cytochrome c556
VRLTKITTGIAVLCLAGAAIAAEATDPTVKARQEAMDAIAANVKVLGDMAGDKAPFDAAKAEEAKAGLAATVAMVPDLFRTEASDPKSTAKPEIWSNFADFETKTKALADAAVALDATSIDGVKAGMGAIGGACKGCHTTYRIPS